VNPRRSLAWLGSVAGLIFAAISVAPAGAEASALQPLDLRVDGGEESWHAEPSFALRWTNPLREGQPPVAAVHYRLLDPQGQATLAAGEIGWPATSIQHLAVPAAPGAYTAEVWLEDAAGEVGDPVAAALRFDDAAPGQGSPPPVAGWIGRSGLPFALRLDRPAGPEPLSGIRGYAISIDAFPGASPCADRYTCSEAETDLRGGAGDDLLALEWLPEGESYLNVLAVSGSGVHSAAVGSTVLRVDKTDPVARLSGVPEDWSNRPLTLTVTATDGESGMLASGPGGPFTAIRADGGAPTVAAGDVVATTLIGSGVHTIAYYARDAAGNVADGGTLNGQPNNPPATATVRIDRETPQVAFSNTQDPDDPERIEAHVADSLSGVDRDRGRISVRPLGSGERFEDLPTEFADGTLRARWSSEEYAPGAYEFRATAYDRAGNVASTTSRGNGAAMRLVAPLKTSTTLRASLGGDVRQSVPYGRGATIAGRLVAGRRAPLAGAPVLVVERFASGSRPAERTTAVRTGQGGGFELRLSPGPSREIVALAPATATLRGASSRPLRLAVRAGLRLSASSAFAKVGGRPVVFLGRVLSAGAAIPAEGKSVQLQFRLPGLPWSEFRTIRTDRRGRFRYPYRFADDDSRGARFQFRAFAPAQAGWPYEPAGSAPVAVLGR